MSALLKSSSCWAEAPVPLAASIARPETSCRRVSVPFSKRVKRSEMIGSMAASFRQKDDLGGNIAWNFIRSWRKVALPEGCANSSGDAGFGYLHLNYRRLLLSGRYLDETVSME